MAAAFNSHTLNTLQGNVRTLYARRRLIGRLTLTSDEYLQTFVPRHAWDLFREVTPMIKIDRLTHRFDLRAPIGSLKAYLMMEESAAMPTPRVLQVQPDAPREILERINHWLEGGGDVSRDFGRVGKLLVYLNDRFSRQAIRYYWPTILAICSLNDNTKVHVQELQELRPPAKLKPLPPGVAKACRLAAETIATARLIPTDVEDTHVNSGISIEIVAGEHYVEEFNDFYGMT